MAGVTSIEGKESLDELVQQLPHVKMPRVKERLQVLYWLKQEKAPTIGAIAKVIGKHRNTVGSWLLKYREGGAKAILERKSLAGGVRKMPPWAEEALAKRLKDAEHGFNSYGEVEQWLAETLDVEATSHAVCHMTRYRLQAKLKEARPQNSKQQPGQREAFQETLQTP